MMLDETDRRILNRIQTRFPIAPRPYGVIAEDLGLTEDEVMSRIKRLKEKDVIRRIGGNFVPEKVGFVSTLCAARVPETAIEHFAEVVNRYPGVTHNYQRDNDLQHLVHLHRAVDGGNRGKSGGRSSSKPASHRFSTCPRPGFSRSAQNSISKFKFPAASSGKFK